LHDICRLHHSVKVNTALKAALGEPDIVMQSLISGHEPHRKPDFLSTYRDIGTEQTALEARQARVVGIVRCFNQWNSSMRSESPAQRVRYLEGLSDLHYFLRQHDCRYGFIMNEIELVCVRCGGEPDENGVPYFGYLELSDPIRMATCGGTNSATDMSSTRMTTGLALFYLHMLAGDSPLQGQYGWRLKVGDSAAMTRKRHLDRDEWMPKPNQREMREAKRGRGWVWFDETCRKRGSTRSRKASSKC